MSKIDRLVEQRLSEGLETLPVSKQWIALQKIKTDEMADKLGVSFETASLVQQALLKISKKEVTAAEKKNELRMK